MSAFSRDRGAQPSSTCPPSLGKRVCRLLFGQSLDLQDKSVFHHLSLIAFFAWVGLGADGLSSSCYGPAEAFLALGRHTTLAILVALATGATVFIISAAYSQIIHLFPTGGGGYVVASKLLSPTVGMFSGCALLIDYVLTISLSVASGADAVFSFLPPEWHFLRLPLAVAGVLLLTLLNMRGVKESVLVLMPIFLLFVATHAAVILYGLGAHLGDLPALAARTGRDLAATHAELGGMGMVLLLLRAYSMGAGTYTGIEAVSNGLPILREPKEATGKRTMLYMALSLSLTVVGLMVCYLLFSVAPEQGKTLNAVLFANITADFGVPGQWFVLVTLVSEAALLFVAAQAGFVDGPRVLANLAQDRWLPTRFALLSDRLVTQNGILLMGGAALVLMLVSHGSVDLLIVLYSINVFITFTLSQLGMVRHWWQARGREQGWGKGLALNGVGLALTGFILVSVTVVKFDEGGWATLLVTGLLAACAMYIRRHYAGVGRMLRKLDGLVEATEDVELGPIQPLPAPEAGERVAVLLVGGFNGLGLHTLLSVHKMFPDEFKNFLFVQVAQVDAGAFKSAAEVAHLRATVEGELNRYVRFANSRGWRARGLAALGVDVVQEIMNLVPQIKERHPRAVFIGGQLVFPDESWFTRLLHNYVVFSVQRRLYREGLPFVIMPVQAG